jgi:hypothetical protein
VAQQVRNIATKNWIIDLVGGLLVLIALGALGLAVIHPINRLTRPGAELTVPVTAQHARSQVAAVLTNESALPDPGQGGYLNLDEATVEATLHSDDAPHWLQLLTEAPRSLEFLCFALGAILVRRLLLAIRTRRPFDGPNVKRLFALAALAILGSYGPGVLFAVARDQLLKHLHLAGGNSPFAASPFFFDISALILAGILIALARAFEVGRRLTQDVEGLV